MFAHSSHADDNDWEAYEKVKQEYCMSDNQEWSKIDHMLNCYIAASDAVSVMPFNMSDDIVLNVFHLQRPSVVKDCERKTFADVGEAKAAFCSEQGAQTIGKVNLSTLSR